MGKVFGVIMVLAIMLISNISAPAASAQLSSNLNYQGYLTDSSGDSVPDGSYNITFRIYNVPTEGAWLWQEAQSVTVTGGLFNVILGNTTSIYMPFNTDYWLGVEIETDGEMIPRQQLVPNPSAYYAFKANDAEGLGGNLPSYYAAATDVFNVPSGTAGNYLRSNGGDWDSSAIQAGDLPDLSGQYIQNQTTVQTADFNISGSGTIGTDLIVSGNVGIGTAIPATNLHLTGNIYSRALIEGTNFGQLILGESDASVDEKYFHVSASDTGLSMGGISDALNGWSNALTVTRNSEVGIGTNDPSNILHIKKQSIYTDGYDGAFIDIQNYHPSTNVTSGIRFKNGNEANTTKGAIYYQDKLSNGRGDILFANDSVDNASNVTTLDAKMVILNNGNVGIGTLNPSTELEVSGTITASTIISNDNLGIGTTTPVEELCISGDSYTRIFAEGSYVSQLILGDSDDAVNEKYFHLSSTGEQFSIGAIADNLGGWSSSQFVMTRTGNVGIGTADPSSKLEVSGDITVTGTVDGRYVSTDGAKLDGISSGASDTTNDSWVGTSNVSMTTGRVGIGTSSPNEILEIAGNGRVFIGDGGGPDRTGLLIDAVESGDHVRLAPFDYEAFTAMDLYLASDVGIGISDPNSALQIEGYIQLDTISGAPPPSDCDDALERGRMKYDPATDTCWICSNSGWSAH